MNDKLLYRIPEVVGILNVSRSKVYELLRSGQLRRCTSTAPVWSATRT